MRLLTTVSLLLFSIGLRLCAQTTNMTNMPTRQVSLEESIELALQHNLDVQIERVNPEIARYNLGIAYADWEPFLSASGTHNFNSTPAGVLAQGIPFPGNRSESDSFSAGIGGPGVGASGLLPSGLTYSLSGSASDSVFRRLDTNNIVSETSRGSVLLNLRQPLLKNFWIDTTRLNIQVNKKRLKMSELGLQQQIMNVVNNTALAYYELIFSRENIKVQQAAMDLADRLVAENKKRVQIGTLAPLDEKQAESQAASSKADLLAAQNAAATQENVLKGLLTDQYTSLHGTKLVPTEELTAPIPVLNLKASWAKGLTQRPDLLQSRIDLERLDIVLRYTYNQLFPELDLIGSYGFTGSGKEFSGALGQIAEGSGPNYSFGASLTIPLGNRAARGNYKITKEQKKLALLQLKKQEQTILVQIDDAVKQVQNAFERVDATRQARAYAETALDANRRNSKAARAPASRFCNFSAI